MKPQCMCMTGFIKLAHLICIFILGWMVNIKIVKVKEYEIINGNLLDSNVLPFMFFLFWILNIINNNLLQNLRIYFMKVYSREAKICEICCCKFCYTMKPWKQMFGIVNYIFQDRLCYTRDGDKSRLVVSWFKQLIQVGVHGFWAYRL